MKSKKSIISCLCFISLLSACNNSSSIIDTSSPNDETNKVLLQEMLNKASEGVSLESLVTIKSKVNIILKMMKQFHTFILTLKQHQQNIHTNNMKITKIKIK